MPNLEIDGIGIIEIDDSFNQLTPQEQNNFVSQIISQSNIQAQQSQQETPKPQSQQKKISKAESALAGFGQGASFGFGDEIIAGLTTPVIKLGAMGAEALGYNTQGLAQKSLGEIYRQEQQKGQQEIQQAQEQNPASFLGGEIVGSVTGVGKLAPQKLTSALRAGSLPVRMAKGAVAGAGTSGLYGAGVAEPNKIVETAIDYAKTGAVVGGAIPAVSAGVNKLMQPKPNLATAKELRVLASQSYEKAAQEGGVLKSNVVNKFVDDISSLSPQTTEGKILAGDDAFSKLVERIGALKDRNISLKGAQEIDEILGNKIDSFFDPKTGRLTKEGLKISQIQQAFRKSIEQATAKDIVGSKQGFEALKEARSLWAKSARVNDIERIIARADQADNPATALRTSFRTLANNPSKLRGFSQEEIKAIKKAAKTGIVTDTLRILGSRLLPIGAIATGGGVGGATTAQLGSIASRGLAGKMQAKKAENVLNIIYGKKAMTQLPKYPLTPATLSPAITNELNQ